jgi:F-type H+-transporting ATPase subunit epsilon
MKVIILSPEKQLYEAEVDRVVVPGEMGQFEVLENHAPIISTLVKGVVACFSAESYTLEIQSGFIECVNNTINICVEL